MTFVSSVAAFGRHPNTGVLRSLVDGPRRFSELVEACRLTNEIDLGASVRELDAAGLLTRRVDPGPPLRVLYELTTAGRELAPALMALAAWADHRDLRPDPLARWRQA